eukprot:scaffold40890_cov66-Phaeocystis_antarctica.AAC.4
MVLLLTNSSKYLAFAPRDDVRLGARAQHLRREQRGSSRRCQALPLKRTAPQLHDTRYPPLTIHPIQYVLYSTLELMKVVCGAL